MVQMAFTGKKNHFSHKIAMIHFQQLLHYCLDDKLLMISSSFIHHVTMIRSDKFNFFYGK